MSFVKEGGIAGTISASFSKHKVVEKFENIALVVPHRSVEATRPSKKSEAAI
jgi:hypothetical protein